MNYCRVNTLFRDAAIFFRELVRHPRQVASVIPSSGFLKKRIVRNANLANVRLVVELGPGHGGTTRAILDAMPADAILLSIEINHGLYLLTSRIADNRCIAHHGDASQLAQIMAEYNLQQPDVIISGIPFSKIDTVVGAAILKVIYDKLAPNGRFVAYQLSNKVEQLNRFFEAESRTCEVEWLCVPPMKVWCWYKRTN